nr:hypothetical protein [Tanacetum cinerariifolium]
MEYMKKEELFFSFRYQCRSTSFDTLRGGTSFYDRLDLVVLSNEIITLKFVGPLHYSTKRIVSSTHVLDVGWKKMMDDVTGCWVKFEMKK